MLLQSIAQTDRTVQDSVALDSDSNSHIDTHIHSESETALYGS